MRMWESKGRAYRFPGVPNGNWPREETASWVNVTQYIGHVRSTCLAGTGYALVGSRRAVGVVRWPTNGLWVGIVRMTQILGEHSPSKEASPWTIDEIEID